MDKEEEEVKGPVKASRIVEPPQRDDFYDSWKNAFIGNILVYGCLFFFFQSHGICAIFALCWNTSIYQHITPKSIHPFFNAWGWLIKMIVKGINLYFCCCGMLIFLLISSSFAYGTGVFVLTYI